MHIAALSAVLAASGALASVHPGQGLHHRNFASDVRTSLKRAAVPDTLKDQNYKRADEGNIIKRCKIRPSTSNLTVNRNTPTESNNNTSSSSSSSSSSSRSNSPQPTPPANVGTSEWSLKQNHEGSSFFDKWDFWSFPDPTYGVVDYQDRGGAYANNLVEINGAGNAIMRVETTQFVGGNRKSIRLHDTFIFTGALVILDAVHAPVGCGTWPAFWSNGPDWPNGGEIDIYEGVHTDSVNQASIHTGSGCWIPDDPSAADGQLVGGPNCASYESGNSGCGFRDVNTPNTFGDAFNAAGGGVYAMKWDETGIAVYFFTRSAIPADITAGVPQPNKWGKPKANWPATSCNPYTYFRDHFAIFDTTLCGDWAGATWGSSGCAASTGNGSCEGYVRENGGAFGNAYWEVKSVKICQK